MARGSIRPRETRRGVVFDVTYDVPGLDGRRRQQRRTAASRQEADQILAQALSEVYSGARRASTGLTFADVAEAWLKAKTPRLEESTRRDYRTHLDRRLLPAFGDLRVEKVTRGLIEAYMADLDEAGTLSRKTINDSLIPLRQILGRAVRERLIVANPAASVDRDEPLELPYEPPQMRYLTREQAPRYLAACSAWYRPLAELLIGSGLRIGEAVALTWADVDLDGMRIVERTAKVGGIGTPKGDKARTVTIGPFLARALREHRRESGRVAGLVFPSTTGTMLNRDNVRRRGHDAALAGARLDPVVRLHDLRHTAATLWLASGESIYFVQQQLGHADIQTTINLYGHPDQAAHRDAAARSESWWREASG